MGDLSRYGSDGEHAFTTLFNPLYSPCTVVESSIFNMHWIFATWAWSTIHTHVKNFVSESVDGALTKTTTGGCNAHALDV